MDSLGIIGACVTFGISLITIAYKYIGAKYQADIKPQCAHKLSGLDSRVTALEKSDSGLHRQLQCVEADVNVVSNACKALGIKFDASQDAVSRISVQLAEIGTSMAYLKETMTEIKSTLKEGKNG
jgi:hypothetical protein